MKANSLVIYILLIACLTACKSENSGDQSASLKVIKTDRDLLVKASLPAEVKEIEVRISSSRNHTISKRSDVSVHDPRGKSTPDQSLIWYPIVDVMPEKNTQGVAVFEGGVEGRYSINGMFFKDISQLSDNTIIPGDKLLYWENSLCVQPEGILKDFYLSIRVPVKGRKFQHLFKLLSSDWTGTISLYAMDSGEERRLAEYSLPAKSQTEDESHAEDESLKLAQLKGQGISHERLIEALSATLSFTLGCQNESPNSPSIGGLNLFYDLEAKTYRRPHWIWGWGPSIKLLLDASNLPELSSLYSPGELTEAAIRIGAASREFICREAAHPAYGVVTSRWKEDPENMLVNAGFEKFYSVADAQFLIGWGYIPLYRETGDQAYLDDSKLLATATQRLLGEFEIIPMDYVESSQSWKNYTINEAGFGTEGLAELYQLTKDTSILRIGRTYMDRLLSRFQQDDGFWARSYAIDAKETRASFHHTRGQGWAMEGLLASDRMFPNDTYREHAIQMAEKMMEYQHPSGYWSYAFTEPAEEVGISEKGTALWCLLFYRLYNISQDARHLETARKALLWCMDNQYAGSDQEAYGGIVGLSSQSGVTYRSWFPLACTYTSGFFGLALLEELGLEEELLLNSNN